MLLKNAAVVLPDGVRENVSILVKEGLIAGVYSAGESVGAPVTSAFSSGDVIDAGGSTVFPGFIDLHIHGAVGVDVNEADADGLLEIAAFLARNGVTAWMPTLVPDSDENYRRAIAAIDALMEMQVSAAGTTTPAEAATSPLKGVELVGSFFTGARAVGVHYEGVFANEKMCGALRPEYFKSSSQWSVVGGQLPRLKTGIQMTTLAPEIDGGIDLIRELVKQNWVASIGHTRADAGTLDKAFAAGAKHVTHFYNAMTGLHHRDLGVAGWALTNKDVTFDIIADGIHSDPRMLELAVGIKTPDKVSLISDSVAPTGLGDGKFQLWGETITVENGKTRNERGSIAGSVITMLDAVNRMLSLGFSPADVAKMASLNPAKLLGIDKTHGSIELGKRADLVVIDTAGSVKMTVVGGEVVGN